MARNMDHKVLSFDLNKCTGCRACEIRCSFKHFRLINPTKSRIRIIKFEEFGLNVPTVCQQCTEAACMKVCPTKALREDLDTGARIIDDRRCIGCNLCMNICPFGALTLTSEKKLIKCTLCQGDPYCVKYCETGALSYEKVEKTEVEKRYQFAKKMADSVK
ncbi:MAG: 4Fe-4S dicluster domain-containing protein [Thermodesulfobacteriota bacterium]|nr:4Fe-4S dicluster domain-containing protein [Thermodesulfobacteriota bacterium]